MTDSVLFSIFTVRSRRERQSLGKRIAFVGLGFSDKGFTKYVVDMEFALGGDLSITGMFIENEKTTTEVGYQIAKKLREPVRRMDEAELMAEVGRFIEDHHVLVIATGTDDFVRATPLEYIYLNGVFYVITEGGLKYRSILENGNASVTIFDRFDGSFEHIRSLQIFGKAQPVKSQTKEYSEIVPELGFHGTGIRRAPAWRYGIQKAAVGTGKCVRPRQF